MGTRANIVRQNADGSFDSIHTHWDGYPEHHAPILLEHYSTPELVQALLDLGDLSILDTSVGTKHGFESRPTGECTAYGRDRGETGVESQHYADREALNAMLADAWTEWIYFYDVGTAVWSFMNNPSPTWFKCCGTSQLPLRPLTEWQAEVSQ